MKSIFALVVTVFVSPLSHAAGPMDSYYEAVWEARRKIQIMDSHGAMPGDKRYGQSEDRLSCDDGIELVIEGLWDIQINKDGNIGLYKKDSDGVWILVQNVAGNPAQAFSPEFNNCH